jgi:quercetin dioxygenase-like cupin family protein
MLTTKGSLVTIPYLAQAADHERLEWLGGGIMQVLLDARHTGGRLAMFRSTAAQNSASPVHVHPNEDEIVVLLSGSGVFWAGDQRYELTEGGVAFLPRDVPHAYRITSPSADMLAIATPAGMEEFFRAAGWDLSRPKPEGWAITPADLAAAGKKHGQTVLGPPLGVGDMIPADYLG